MKNFINEKLKLTTCRICSGPVFFQCFGSGSFCPVPDQTFVPESGSAKKAGSDPENPVIKDIMIGTDCSIVRTTATGRWCPI